MKPLGGVGLGEAKGRRGKPLVAFSRPYSESVLTEPRA